MVSFDDVLATLELNLRSEMSVRSKILISPLDKRVSKSHSGSVDDVAEAITAASIVGVELGS